MNEKLHLVFSHFQMTKQYFNIFEGITIQRSKEKDAVMNMYRKKSRPSLTLMEEDAGGKSMKDLIDWLYQTNELNKEYHYLESNCQHFGKGVFNFMALNKNI